MAETLIDLTDEAIKKLLQKKAEERFSYIRLGITGGGCAGFEYIFDSTSDRHDSDVLLDFGKIQILIDKPSVPYLYGMTLDYQKQGLNEIFVFENPKEQHACGCGVSINFDLEAVERDNRITAIQL